MTSTTGLQLTATRLTDAQLSDDQRLLKAKLGLGYVKIAVRGAPAVSVLGGSYEITIGEGIGGGPVASGIGICVALDSGRGWTLLIPTLPAVDPLTGKTSRIEVGMSLTIKTILDSAGNPIGQQTVVVENGAPVVVSYFDSGALVASATTEISQ